MKMISFQYKTAKNQCVTIVKCILYYIRILYLKERRCLLLMETMTLISAVDIGTMSAYSVSSSHITGGGPWSPD